jgi:hypothetical protein
VIRSSPLLAAAALAAACGAASAPPEGAVARAGRLAEAPAAGGPAYSPSAARLAANVRGTTIPLPAGGNFNGIRWEQAGQRLPAAAIVGVLEYNAACQWLRTWRDGRDRPLAVRVLRTVRSWPAFRGTEAGRSLARVAAEAAAGGGRSATAALTECDASHAREVAFATGRGLTPST